MSGREEIIRECGSERLLELLNTVDQSVSRSSDAHIVDDDVLLECWSSGRLTPDEHEQIIQHLARCYECSEVIRDMIDAEVFELPDQAVQTAPAAESDREGSSPGASSTSSRVEVRSLGAESFRDDRPRFQAQFAVTTVACAMIAVVGYVATRDRDGIDPQVMLAQTDFAQLTHYLNEAEFAAVAAGRYGKGALTTSFVPPDAERDHRLERLAMLVQTEPSRIANRLDYGQVLLKAGRFNDAAAEFQAVLDYDASNAFAQLGMGLVLFRQKDTVAAESVFALLIQDRRVAIPARLNQIVCLIALERRDEARELWKSVPQSARPRKLGLVLAAGMNSADDEP